MYQHQTIARDNQTSQRIDLPVGKVVCVGQNYADHIKEMNSKPANEALLFIKPSTSLVDLQPSFAVPTDLGECHNETELAVLIQSPLTQAQSSQVKDAIWGYGIALDLTLREVQKQAKQAGRPWERAKAFDGACPISGFVNKSDFSDPQACQLKLTVNGEVRQNGNTAQMLRTIDELIAEISQVFTLLPGDIVITGTPAGVGPLQSGDQLQLELADQFQFVTTVN